MEENKEKVNCCENKEKCGHCEGKHCCNNWKKCHLVKRIVWIIIVILAFCAGSQWGEMKAKTDRDYRFERGGMMGWGYNQQQNQGVETKTDSVTIKVVDPNAQSPKQ